MGNNKGFAFNPIMRQALVFLLREYWLKFISNYSNCTLLSTNPDNYVAGGLMSFCPWHRNGIVVLRMGSPVLPLGRLFTRSSYQSHVENFTQFIETETCNPAVTQGTQGASWGPSKANKRGI